MMNIHIDIADNAAELGKRAAKKIAALLNDAIREKGSARMILSTGASQFETLEALVKEDVDWTKVEMFHLDEYAGLPSDHPASFRRYLEERFVSRVHPGSVHYVSWEGDMEKNIRALSEAFRSAPVDIGVIGIGENGHIAFNDPPADFTTDEIYKIVVLDRKCREQQVHEGWFSSVDEVPQKAITMCPKAILSCRHIVSAVPHGVKAEAVRNTIASPVTPMVPATLLKTHTDWYLFLDKASAGLL